MTHASKCDNVSLNDELLKGPDLLNSLISVLLKFREGKFAAIADIKQMFNQILVKPEDRDSLRFVWRYNKTEQPQDYVMNVHLFGKADSPCIANWCIRKCADDQKDQFDSDVIKLVKENFYMDDFLNSAYSAETLIKLALSIIKLLQKDHLYQTSLLLEDSQPFE